MSYLIQILLPVIQDGEAYFDEMRTRLADRFGGVTFYRSAPAEGFWKEHSETECDDIVVAEVMTDTVDDDWWKGYRRELERRLRQEEIVIRALEIRRL